MASIKYDVKLLTEKKRKRVYRKNLKEGDIYCGKEGIYKAVVHVTPRAITTLNLSTGAVCSVGISQSKIKGKYAPSLHLVGVLAKDSLKLVKR